PVTVSFAVDPELLDAAQTLASGSPPGAATGAGWLEKLRTAGLSGRVLALPYADPDVSALARDTRTKDDVANASALATDGVGRGLHPPAAASVAWPPAGPVTSTAADALALSGARTFVLDPSAYN